MKPPVGALGNHIREFRKRERYTISSFAKHSGLSKAQIFGIEHGTEINPRIATVIALAKATNTTIARIATLAAVSRAIANERGEGK